jgi:hypothetical protein
MSTATAIDRDHCGLPVCVQIGPVALVQAGAPDPMPCCAAMARCCVFSHWCQRGFQAADVMVAVLKACDLLVVAR